MTLFLCCHALPGKSDVTPVYKVPFRLLAVMYTKNRLAICQKTGFPKFTNEVQHFLYKVLRWDKNMNSFRWNNVARLPGIAKPGKQCAKSRQLWIARHRL